MRIEDSAGDFAVLGTRRRRNYRQCKRTAATWIFRRTLVAQRALRGTFALNNAKQDGEFSRRKTATLAATKGIAVAELTLGLSDAAYVQGVGAAIAERQSAGGALWESGVM